MGLLGWIIFGLLTGLVARAIFPGEQKPGSGRYLGRAAAIHFLTSSACAFSPARP